MYAKETQIPDTRCMYPQDTRVTDTCHMFAQETRKDPRIASLINGMSGR